MWEFLENNKLCGQLRGEVVYDKRDQNIGAYLYYLKPKEITEVVLLVARKDRHDIVFKSLLSRIYKEGGTCATGRMEPRFLKCFWNHSCLIKRGSWGLVHARDPELINIVNRGDAFLTSLEGELWLRSPTNSLLDDKELA